MKAEKLMDKKYLAMALMLVGALLFSGCGSKQVRGESPMLRISELSHQDGNVNLQLSIRNVNDEELDILELDFKLTTEDQQLLGYSGPAPVNIVANGTESWSVEIVEDNVLREQLDALQNDEIKSLPYLLEGSIRTLDTGKLRFETRGHLYPLPGRPGYFR